MGNHPSSEKSGRTPQKAAKSHAVGSNVVSPPKLSSTNHQPKPVPSGAPQHSGQGPSKVEVEVEPRLGTRPNHHTQSGRNNSLVDRGRQRDANDQFPLFLPQQDGSGTREKAIDFGGYDATNGSGAINSRSSGHGQAHYRPWGRPDRSRSVPNVATYSGSRSARTSLDSQTSGLPHRAYHQETFDILTSGYHSQDALDKPVGRTQSDASLYIPIRRRSKTETPGVATRLETPVKAPATKKESRSSLPPAFSSFHFEDYQNPARRRMSTPPLATALDNPNMAETPSENDYKQLGVMKFGSLRIINETPVSTPGGLASSSAITSEGRQGDYFQLRKDPGMETSMSPTERNESSRAPVTSQTSTSGDVDVLAQPDRTPSRTPETMSQSKTSTTSSLDSETAATSVGSAQTKSSASVRRSDSGISLKHSSARPGAHVQHTDSGYSSSLSLRSIFGSKKKKEREAEQKAVQKEKMEQTLAPCDELAPAQQAISSMQSDQHSPANPIQEKQQNGRPEVAHRTALLGSRKSGDSGTRSVVDEPVPRKSQDSSSLKSNSRVTARTTSDVREAQGHGQQGVQANHTQRTSQNAEAAQPPATAEIGTSHTSDSAASKRASVGSGLAKSTRFERLFSSRRRSMPEVYSTQTLDGVTPPMPADAQEKLREHRGAVSATNTEQRHHVQHDQKEPGAPRLSHLSRAASILSPKSKPRSLEKQRRSLQAQKAADMDSESLVGFEAQVASLASIRRSAGNSAFDQAFVPLSVEYGFSSGHERAHRKTGHKTHEKSHKQPRERATSNHHDRAGSRSRERIPERAHVKPYERTASTGNLQDMKRGKPPPLRTRRSAPEFLETVRESGSFPDMGMSMESAWRAPPPVSLHTRGTKKSRRSKHHGSSRAMYTPSDAEPLPPLPRGLSNGQMDGDRDPHRQYLSHSLRTIPIASAERRRSVEGPRGSRERSDPRNMPNPHESGRSGRSRPYYPHAGVDGTSRAHEQSSPDFPSNATPRGHTGENRANGPPFRVLHSYNSPSYRGVPIWSA